jgi:Carbohydrate-selective porin, OprB family/S-layer homology domain
MQKLNMKSLHIGIFALLLPLLVIVNNSNKAQAQDTNNNNFVTQINDPLGSEINLVTELSDVKPTDWAYEALTNLVERYKCNLGYADNSYRGNQAITRYEFAAALNSCLESITKMMATNTVNREDLAIIEKLQSDFVVELSKIQQRINVLEAKTDNLEKQQFSTTTKLRGEMIFSLGGVIGDERTGGGDLTENTTLSYRARLNLISSFTGKDELRVRLQGRNIIGLNGVTGTNMSRISYDGDSQGALQIDDLFYRFPLGDKTKVWLIANGYGSENIANPLNPFLQSDGSGSVSRFARFSPLYRIVDGAGIAAEHKFSDQFTLSAAYRARNANNPNSGLFGGNYSALTQLTFAPSKNLAVGFTYSRAYYEAGSVDATGSTGSAFARQPFGNVATATNSYGLTSSWRINPKINLSGWVGLTDAQAVATGRNAEVWNWLVSLAFPDLGKKGNLAGLIVGMPPKASYNDLKSRQDSDTSIHLEALYRHQINDKISVTPGLIVIFNPEHNQNNDTQLIGVVRTTFSF